MNTQPFAPTAHTLAGKYLSFSVGNRSYALPVRNVREIVQVPFDSILGREDGRACGMVLIREQEVPVLDLRAKFGMMYEENQEMNEPVCLVVVRLGGTSVLARWVAVAVDEVDGVVTVWRDEIVESPDFHSEVNPHYLLGMTQGAGPHRFLLDIDQLLKNEPLEMPENLRNFDLPKKHEPALMSEYEKA